MPDRILCRLMPTVVVSFLLVSSGYSQSVPPSSTTPPATDRSQRPVDTKDAASMNSAPMMQAIEMNVVEVEAGRMASGKATNPRVKEFADMMVKDHTEALNKLRGGTQSSPTTATDVKPIAKHQQLGARLSQLAGAEFDREYMKAMVADHQEALKFFERQSRGRGGSADPSETPSGTPPASTKGGTGERPDTGIRPSGSMASGGADLASISQELLPAVRHHLELAQQIQNKLESGSGSAPDRLLSRLPLTLRDRTPRYRQKRRQCFLVCVVKTTAI